jgi:hypothetical protein
MPIADAHYFSQDHIESVKLNASTALAEQAIHCLELVAELATVGLPYQFKGGNSLLLILDAPQRFSIDVDIATDATREQIETALEQIVRRYGTFIRWEKRQHKTKPWIPLSSYYLFYQSLYVAPDQAFVMLDAQLKRSPYKTGMHTVASGDIYRSSAQVELPYPSSIIGDKLLTMGPFTMGIPLGKGKEAQRLKHVYDVSTLLKIKPKLSEVHESCIACMEHENALQQKSITLAQVVDDTVQFCATTAAYSDKPVPEENDSSVLKENVKGLDDFASHLFTKGYNWKRLQTDMSRVALCISALANDSISDAQFHDALDGKLALDTKPISSLLSASNAEASYNWTITAAWLGKNPLESL